MGFDSWMEAPAAIHRHNGVEHIFYTSEQLTHVRLEVNQLPARQRKLLRETPSSLVQRHSVYAHIRKLVLQGVDLVWSESLRVDVKLSQILHPTQASADSSRRDVCAIEP